MVARTIERQGQVLENLLFSPGSRVPLPTVGESGQVSGRIGSPKPFDEAVVFGREAFVDEQSRTRFFQRTRGHARTRAESGECHRDESRSTPFPRKCSLTNWRQQAP